VTSFSGSYISLDGEHLLFAYTVLVGKSRSYCGNCDANVLPGDQSACHGCGVPWKFMASMYYQPGQSLHEMAQDFESQFGGLTFIGLVGGGIGDYHLYDSYFPYLQW
jgi:hypothetical protein